jgi:rSAM/selenodomain-associated transferase 2
LAPPEATTPALSVVIPALDSVDYLGNCLDALNGTNCEIIVVDGGSSDGTQALAASRGARVLTSATGRGAQLVAGAAAARGRWLLFLHADTRLSEGWRQAATEFMAAGDKDHAGYFRYALDDDAPAARRLEALVAWRCRLLGLPYGDQGLLIAREFYQRLGGFRPMPLMEDVEFIRRIGRRRLVMLDAQAMTSAARYRRDGYLRRSGRNMACLALYHLGLPPRSLVRLYG